MLYGKISINGYKQLVTSGFILRLRMVSMTLVLLLLSLNNVFAQNKRMVAIGSSTTAGYITTSPDSSWFGRFSKYYKCRVSIMDSSLNFGVSGAGVYTGMPTGCLPPPGRPNPDMAKNVSKAVAVMQSLASPEDGVIIVNYPSNQYNIYSIAEIMNCLQLIYDSATVSGNLCFITTTQPRTDSLFDNSAMKKKLADIKDSTLNRFGVAHTINFWDGMYNPVDTTILPIYSAGDQIHFNDAGHRVLFERILAKNVFSLPAWYAAPHGNLNLLTSWGANADGTGRHPAGFAINNQVFIITNNPTPTINANWTISGKNVQLIVGDGIKPVSFKIPAGFRVTVSNPPPSACK
ncbi:MAG: SGNH/GDSL hydrolase family protein [Ferruginibacter sp.]